MRSKTKREIAECVAILNMNGGKDALEQRLTMVKDRINNLESEAESYERERSQIYDRIVELEMERDIIEHILTIGTVCAHCQIAFNTLPYKTPLMGGKVFCSRECALSELSKTIEEIEEM